MTKDNLIKKYNDKIKKIEDKIDKILARERDAGTSKDLSDLSSEKNTYRNFVKELEELEN